MNHAIKYAMLLVGFRYVDKEGTFLVPFAEALVPIIDTEEKMIVLADIEGLF